MTSNVKFYTCITDRIPMLFTCMCSRTDSGISQCLIMVSNHGVWSWFLVVALGHGADKRGDSIMRKLHLLINLLQIVLLTSLFTGCSDKGKETTQATGEAQTPAASEPVTPDTINPPPNPTRNAYFGDLHVHSALSIDAYITNTRTMPDDAYRYAKGEAIDHVSGQKIRISTPLDFMAVTDHAEMLGVARTMNDPSSPLSKGPLAAEITSQDYKTSHGAFAKMVRAAATGQVDNLISVKDAVVAVKTNWQLVIDTAEKHYQPHKFTTFVAYEWTSMPQMANLHRNVIFRGTNVPPLPFSSTQSSKPEDLWRFLEDWRKKGDDVIAIPHNSNASKGLMYPVEDSFGNPVNKEYASRRMNNEPITEVTQFKGTSETHPVLSPLDEFADFEIWNTVVGGVEPVEPDAGGYVRTAYQRGLEMQNKQGFNPYKFGLIGSSDTHNSSTAVDEFNFTGGHGNADMTPEKRLNSKPSTLATSSLNFSASGLAGVWAQENTRESIFEAMRNKETFATSGPRIMVRFFAGNYSDDLMSQSNALEKAYADGVPMGGEMTLNGKTSPSFLVWANKDPKSAMLQRVQVVKGWVEAGEAKEAIYDVACADGLTVDANTHRCPDNGATVNVADCSISQNKGAAELSALWKDPAFDANIRAFYYVRVIENPTCRWSTWDAVRLGVKPPENTAPTLQERAWTSPIWIEPKTWVEPKA